MQAGHSLEAVILVSLSRLPFLTGPIQPVQTAQRFNKSATAQSYIVPQPKTIGTNLHDNKVTRLQ